VDGPARRTIHADGLVLTPGFIDIHTHFDGQAPRWRSGTAGSASLPLLHIVMTG
jgi:imidazolonepropionase-like amidohydrolase